MAQIPLWSPPRGHTYPLPPTQPYYLGYFGHMPYVNHGIPNRAQATYPGVPMFHLPTGPYWQPALPGTHAIRPRPPMYPPLHWFPPFDVEPPSPQVPDSPAYHQAFQRPAVPPLDWERPRGIYHSPSSVHAYREPEPINRLIPPRSPSPFIPPYPSPSPELYYPRSPSPPFYDFVIPSPPANRSPANLAQELPRTANLAHEAPPRPGEQCSICMDQIEQPIAVVPCRHRYCKGCLESHISSALKGHDGHPIQCLDCVAQRMDTPTVLTRDFLQTIGLSAELLDQFDERALTGIAENVSCPTCTSEFSVAIESLENPRIRVIGCPVCNHSFCKNCRRAIKGSRHTCPPDGTEELRTLMQRMGWATCPGCGARTEKELGCNHMQCTSRQCGGLTHWCYSCGGIIIQSDHPDIVHDAVWAHRNRCEGSWRTRYHAGPH
ncbi:unnamed protein product [Somion occarium]|uniref:RING-type domain-containing protein n=1 Tax=Somion occarium TaxID=3059160 RepID=A0ABP1DFJ0_9APHY